MMETLRLTFPVAGVVFRTVLRSRVFLLFSLLAFCATVAGTLPLSPGLTAEPRHYLSAGISTLLLGGVLLSLVVLPGVHPAGRGRMKEEALLALPVPPELFALGSWVGFAAALLVYFAAGGGLFAVVASRAFSGVSPPGAVPAALAAAFLLGLAASALVTLLESILRPASALTAAIVLLLLGQVTLFLPPFAAALLPPFDVLDPSRCFGGGGGAGLADFVRGAACIASYLFLTAAIRAWKGTARSGRGTNTPAPGATPGKAGRADRWDSR